MGLFSRLRSANKRPEPATVPKAPSAPTRPRLKKIELPVVESRVTANGSPYHQGRLHNLGQGSAIFRLVPKDENAQNALVALTARGKEVGWLGSGPRGYPVEEFNALLREAEASGYSVHVVGDVVFAEGSEYPWSIDLHAPTAPHARNVIRKRLRGE